jgi:hypothetical protein
VKKGRNEVTGGGVAIIIYNKLKYSDKCGLYDRNGKMEVCAIELYTGQNKILIVSCYRPPHMKIEFRAWKKFFEQFEVNS